MSDQLWAARRAAVNDITYWKLNESHVYISFVTDAYSHKIVAGRPLPVSNGTDTGGGGKYPGIENGTF